MSTLNTNTSTAEDWAAKIEGDLASVTVTEISALRGYIICLSYTDNTEASRLATLLNSNLKTARDAERVTLIEKMVDKRLLAKYGDLV
jgi:hypothetical protein